MPTMNDMPQMLALVLLLIILYLGDVVSTRTKAWVPSVFICAVLFLLGYWTFFPADIVARAGTPLLLLLLWLDIYFLTSTPLLSLFHH